MAMNKNLTMKMGNCNHRKYIPRLIDLVRSGEVDPLEVLTQVEPMTDAIAATRPSTTAAGLDQGRAEASGGAVAAPHRC